MGLSSLIGCLGRPPFDRQPLAFSPAYVCSQLLTFARQGIPPMGDDAADDPGFMFVDSRLFPARELWHGPPFQRVVFLIGSATRVCGQNYDQIFVPVALNLSLWIQ